MCTTHARPAQINKRLDQGLGEIQEDGEGIQLMRELLDVSTVTAVRVGVDLTRGAWTRVVSQKCKAIQARITRSQVMALIPAGERLDDNLKECVQRAGFTVVCGAWAGGQAQPLTRFAWPVHAHQRRQEQLGRKAAAAGSADGRPCC